MVSVSMGYMREDSFQESVAKIDTVASLFPHRAHVITFSDDPSHASSFVRTNYSVYILANAYSAGYRTKCSEIIAELRRVERESNKPVFVVLSVTDLTDVGSTEWSERCQFALMQGIDAILVNGLLSAEDITIVRQEVLGLRGRRMRIIVEDMEDLNIIETSDGVIANTSLSRSLYDELLRQQKLIISTDSAMAESRCEVDVLICPTCDVIADTAATTGPSSPMALRRAQVPIRSFLFVELQKFLLPQAKLIISLSDDGVTAIDLSTQSRLLKITLPPILALSASESVVRYMGCMYGVTSLRMQSFVSVSSAISEAIHFAKDCLNIVEVGDYVAIVLQPPIVTASTNQDCFEGVVYSLRVC